LFPALLAILRARETI